MITSTTNDPRCSYVPPSNTSPATSAGTEVAKAILSNDEKQNQISDKLRELNQGGHGSSFVRPSNASSAAPLNTAAVDNSKGELEQQRALIQQKIAEKNAEISNEASRSMLNVDNKLKENGDKLRELCQGNPSCGKPNRID